MASVLLSHNCLSGKSISTTTTARKGTSIALDSTYLCYQVILSFICSLYILFPSQILPFSCLLNSLKNSISQKILHLLHNAHLLPHILHGNGYSRHCPADHGSCPMADNRSQNIQHPSRHWWNVRLSPPRLVTKSHTVQVGIQHPRYLFPQYPGLQYDLPLLRRHGLLLRHGRLPNGPALQQPECHLQLVSQRFLVPAERHTPMGQLWHKVIYKYILQPSFAPLYHIWRIYINSPQRPERRSLQRQRHLDLQQGRRARSGKRRPEQLRPGRCLCAFWDGHVPSPRRGCSTL